MKNIVIITLVLVNVLGFQLHGQRSKYLVVPIKYDFLKGQDQYRANTLTRFLFKESGYYALFDIEQLPEDLFKDRCKAIYLRARDMSGFIRTKIQLELTDCKGNLVLISDIGESKEKDLELAYKEAITQAYETLELESVLLKAGEKDSAISTPAVVEDYSKETASAAAVATVATETPEVEKDKTPENNKQEPQKTEKKTPSTLYAQPLDNGDFQLVNMEPRIVMIVSKTDIKNTYKVKGEDAILFKRGDVWVYAKKNNGENREQEYIVKF